MTNQTATQRQASATYSNMMAMDNSTKTNTQKVSEAWAVVWALTVGFGAALVVLSLFIERFF